MFRCLCRFAVFGVISLGATIATAAPFIPQSNDQVLERLPLRPNDPVAKEISSLRSALQRNPQDVDVAVKLARRYYEQVAEEGDPRYLGYAQAALRPWWDMANPPEAVQVMRASLAQFRHDFDGALRDLDAVLDRNPHDVQARALRATIHIVQARYAQGRMDCEVLHGLTSQLVATACVDMVDGLTGKVKAAYQDLARTYGEFPKASAPERLWALLRLAEMAQRQGLREATQRHFHDALALGMPDTFLLSAYSDFLLDARRYAEVVSLLKDKVPSDSLLLRLVLAERALKLPSAEERASQLAARYEAAAMRGDTVHQQEESRFVLATQGDARKALTLASENWKVQKEPRDARVFLEAALAAGDSRMAEPVTAWLASSHIEDPLLIDLDRKLKGVR